MTLVLAIYGAVLSTAVAAWSTVTWVLAQWTRVELRVSVDTLIGSTSHSPAAVFKVVNHSYHPVRLVGLGYEVGDRKQGHGWILPMAFPMFGAPTTPVAIDPRDCFTTWLPRTYLEAWFHNGRGRIRLRAKLSTGKQIRTKVFSPRDIPGYRSFPDELPMRSQRLPDKDGSSSASPDPLVGAQPQARPSVRRRPESSEDESQRPPAAP